MSEVNLVKANIKDIWDDIKDGIDFIKGESYEAETPEDIYYACVNGESAIWVDKNIEPKIAKDAKNMSRRSTKE